MFCTNLKVKWQAHGAQDAFGDMLYDEPQEILARKQPKQSIVKTSEGKEILSKSYFYVDPRQVPEALSIENMDMLDGELVIESYAMCDRQNRVKLMRFITT